MKPFVSAVIPCYNEEGNIALIVERIEEALSSFEHEVIFVDDGSCDKTLDILKSIHTEKPQIKYLSLSRNFGHQNALKAGLDNANGDAIISLDADLQHPPEVMKDLIAKWQEGYEVVYTVRRDNKKTSVFKKLTSRFFYKIINLMSNTRIHEGAADFRLLDRKVVQELQKLTENYLFIRGLISWVGFKQTSVEYTAKERHSGHSKYSLLKMFKFAIAGITSFSIKPLRLSLYLGVFIALLSFVYGIYAVIVTLFTDQTLAGWGSLIASVLFVGGIQLMMLGVIGEYLGKLFMENKKRPNYIVREKSEN